MNTWAHMVQSITKHNDMTGTPVSIDTDAIERARSTITFHAGPVNEEMLKVARDGFWVRGVKVEQDEHEAEIVYGAFKAWMIWAEMNRR